MAEDSRGVEEDVSTRSYSLCCGETLTVFPLLQDQQSWRIRQVASGSSSIDLSPSLACILRIRRSFLSYLSLYLVIFTIAFFPLTRHDEMLARSSESSARLDH